jgi:hypothetical protein
MTTTTRPLPMTEYVDGPINQQESYVSNPEFFRSYVIPVLTVNKEYVTVKCTPPKPKENESLESYSVLIKKTVYKKLLEKDLQQVAELCKEYTDYLPIEMSTSEIIGTDKHGANIKYTTYSINDQLVWNKVESAEYYIRTEDSIRREKENGGVQRKEEKQAKAEAKEQKKKDTLKAFSLEMLEKIK